MKFRIAGNKYLVRLEAGEMLPDALFELASEQNLTSASISGIGGVSDVRLAYYDLRKREYLEFEVEDIVELVSLIGNLSIVDGEPFWHLHAVVADRTGSVKAGHLVRLKVAVTLECWIDPANAVVERAFDQFTGLKLLNI